MKNRLRPPPPLPTQPVPEEIDQEVASRLDEIDMRRLAGERPRDARMAKSGARRPRKRNHP